ncbi:MAG: anthranilate synthase component II [Actinomycetota bacterium]
MRVVVIDNYDSFVFNLVQYLGALGADPVTLRNDTDLAAIEQAAPEAIVISPGPGRPEAAGCCIEVIRRFAGRTPILGVCLGHQAIGVAFGASVIRASSLMHGKTSMVVHDSTGLFAGLPSPLEATRYHSLVIDPATVPAELEVTARTAEGVIMGVAHRSHAIEGVQFHPESVLTAGGIGLIENFLSRVGAATPIS